MRGSDTAVFPGAHAVMAGAYTGGDNNTVDERRRAVRAVAHHAVDTYELGEFLDMLGLNPEEGK